MTLFTDPLAALEEAEYLANETGQKHMIRQNRKVYMIVHPAYRTANRFRVMAEIYPNSREEVGDEG